jgi:ABC-2 type transport system ATP-binding protein
MRTMAEPIVDVVSLKKSYGTVQAVSDVTFRVSRGEFFGLLGPNGAGKTTTISMLVGLVRPTSGRVTIDGLDPAIDPNGVKARLGVVPQDFAFYPTLSARENLAFFGRLYGLWGSRLEARICAVLDTVQLADRANEAVSAFSNGMKRRLNIAIGLVHEPLILILDEPTVGVDTQSRNAILESLESLNKTGVTVLYTTHYIEEAERLCHRVAIMDRGAVIALDTPSALTSSVGKELLLIQFAEAVDDRFLRRLGRLGVVNVTNVERSMVRLETGIKEKVLRELVGLTEESGAHIKTMNILEPDLEAVFLSLTGKHLRDTAGEAG